MKPSLLRQLREASGRSWRQSSRLPVRVSPAIVHVFSSLILRLYSDVPCAFIPDQVDLNFLATTCPQCLAAN